MIFDLELLLMLGLKVPQVFSNSLMRWNQLRIYYRQFLCGNDIFSKFQLNQVAESTLLKIQENLNPLKIHFSYYQLFPLQGLRLIETSQKLALRVIPNKANIESDILLTETVVTQKSQEMLHFSYRCCVQKCIQNPANI